MSTRGIGFFTVRRPALAALVLAVLVSHASPAAPQAAPPAASPPAAPPTAREAFQTLAKAIGALRRPAVRADAAAVTERCEALIELCREFLQRYPDFDVDRRLQVAFVWGQALLELGRAEPAVIYFRALLKVAPPHAVATARLHLCLALSAAGKPKALRAEFERLKLDDPSAAARWRSRLFPALGIGAKAPAFSMTDAEGTARSLAGLLGNAPRRAVVLGFTATPRVGGAAPHTEWRALASEAWAIKRAAFVIVVRRASDVPPGAGTVPTIVDGARPTAERLASLYGVETFPAVIVITPDGKIAARLLGQVPKATLRAAIQQALATAPGNTPGNAPGDSD